MGLPSPQQLEQITNLQIAGYMEPVEEVGGDYYDVVYTNGTVWLGIGDVTGHGLESGVLMLMVQTCAHPCSRRRRRTPAGFSRYSTESCARTSSAYIRIALTLSLMVYRDGVLVITVSTRK
jgi:sigma-B regulation protein RsbU (phosphoserine phosphatase)